MSQFIFSTLAFIDIHLGAMILVECCFSQHGDFATMHNYYFVLADVNGLFGLAYDDLSGFRYVGSYDNLKNWLTLEVWSNGIALHDLRKFVDICFSTQFTHEDALSGKNMQSESFRICMLCNVYHVGVSHELCHCIVSRFFDPIEQPPTYFPSCHLERPFVDGLHLNLIDWLKHFLYGPLTAFLHPLFHFGIFGDEGQ